MKRILAVIFCTALLMSLFPMAFSAAAAGGEAGMLEEIIIKFLDRSQFPDKEQYDAEVAKVLKDGLSVVTDNVYVVKAEDLSKNPNAILNKYKNSKCIEYVEPNYTSGFDAVPNDPNYRTMSAGLTVVGAPAGWDIITGGGPVVAVVDSGVYQHIDLPKLLSGYSAVAGLSPNNDKVGHGTGVAGTIGSLGNNGVGGVGMNWNAKILPVKVDDANGTLSVANIAKGIIWAADNGAKVISLSVSTTSDSVTLKNAIDYAYNKGCAIFASAGNDGKNALNYPARYSNVMAVGATANGTSRAAISNYGAGMGVVAITSYPTVTATGGYATMAGTSFSCPQVSGLASLILALNPNLTNAEVYSYIQQGAKPLGGGYNEQTGYGLIDIGKSLQLVKDKTAPVKKDTTPPVLTLLGNSVMDVKQGNKFTEPGYTATDDADGNITSRVTVTGTVNINTPGVYRLEYKVSDAAGNTATATRVVEVVAVDTAPPVITLKGSASMQMKQGEAFVEPGYTAIDLVDGDVTSKVVRTGTVNVNTSGTYTLTYNVSDAAGNAATPATRTVQVILVDTQPPVITLKGAASIELKQGDKFTEPGYTAVDNVDGDVTSKVTVTGTVNTNTPGTYTLTYRITDAAGNTATAARTVKIVAVPQYTSPPVIKLNGFAETNLFDDDDYIEAGYTATDCLGANITNAVKVTGTVAAVPGMYTLVYEVTDAGGNTARATRTVTVTEREIPLPEPTAPKITIIGSDPIILHLDSGTPYTEQGAYAYDETDGDISGKVTIIGEVDRNKAGTYILTYEVENAGFKATATRTVRILAPNEKREPRATYKFSGQGKAVSTVTHKSVVADEAGYMDFSVTGIDKNMTIKAEIKNQKTGGVVYSNTFTGTGLTQFWAEAGTYDVNVTISAGNGNCKYDVKIVTPEKMIYIFDDEEVPLATPDLLVYLINEGLTPLEICLTYKLAPEDLNAYYRDFIAMGWSDEDLAWFGLTPPVDVPETGDSSPADIPKTGDPAFQTVGFLFAVSLLGVSMTLTLRKRNRAA